jgi:hypothetical protein
VYWPRKVNCPRKRNGQTNGENRLLLFLKVCQVKQVIKGGITLFDFIEKYIDEEIKRQLRFAGHKHNDEYPLLTSTMGMVNISLDNAVNILWDIREKNKTVINDLQKELFTVKSDLAAIHADYREYLCGDCCHADVCIIKESVKFGFECQDKPLPCTFATEENELDKQEQEQVQEQEATDA